jgi:DNA-binding FadR family transcriptional regulator
MAPAISLALAFDNPQLARARELYRRVINEHSEVVSTSAMIADRLEQQVCNAGFATPPITEGMICEQFGVGRRIVRQTSRILRQRGVLTPRRGGNGLGGLCALPPDLPDAVSAIRGELALEARADRDLLGEAGQWLLPALHNRHDPLAEFIGSILARPDALPNGQDKTAGRESLADWLAGRLLEELALSQGRGALGPLAQIASDYGVSIEVAVEAARVLVDAQKVEVKRGRGGGLFACNTGPGRGLHLANAYLAASNVSTEDCREVLDRINTAMIEIASQRRTADGLDRIRHSFSLMQHAANGTDLGRAWYGFIRDIADLASNPVLHFLARSMASSILMRRTRSAELPDSAARELLAASSQILAHLDDARQAPVVAAQSRCQKALENYW